ncbi:MAG: hypothetical protein GF331_00020 [Chitinivibrionales bacterium]|nr:hypothetical protein [Chitinivibrionales bacterium]
MIAGVAKTVVLWLHILAYIAYSLLGMLFIHDRDRRLRFFTRTTHCHARLALRYLGIRVTVKGLEHLPASRAVLLVCNHMSYLDVMVIASVLPTLFITSVEVRDTFFLGLMSKLGGSLFVERRSKSRLLAEIAHIAETVRSGLPVVLFPEGTSSNGDGVMRFKPALFAVSERSGFDLQPLCICYRRIGDEPVHAGNRDRLYYYGGIRFFPHVLGVPFVRSVDVVLEVLPTVASTDIISRKQAAEHCHAIISDTYRRHREAAQATSGAALPAVNDRARTRAETETASGT